MIKRGLEMTVLYGILYGVLLVLDLIQFGLCCVLIYIGIRALKYLP